MTNPTMSAFDPIPSVRRQVPVTVTSELPPAESADAVAVPVVAGQEPPEAVGHDAASLALAGFTAGRGQTLVLPAREGRVSVLVGIGEGETIGAARIRELAADFAAAVPQRKHLAVRLPERELAVSPAEFAEAVVEGVLLQRWRFFLGRGRDEPLLESLTVVAPEGIVAEVEEGVRLGTALARAGALGRDLANCPASTLTATRMAEIARELGAGSGLEVEVFGKEDLVEMGCGGMLGVNMGSVEPPALVRLHYRPESPTGRLALVGKGIMYDSGGISLKPSDESHAQMKNDMTGAATVLAAMQALQSLGCRTEVIGYLCCTDNMPSGSAMKLGDVLTTRNGTTVEVKNTDAEGRLVMADALALAVEDGVDAIVDIATLTGACLRTFGVDVAGLMGNDRDLVEQVREAGAFVDEPVWELPLHRPYRRQLDSAVADISNLGGPNAGTITAGLFLEEFVDGRPWAHLDIAGTAQLPEADAWRNKGASGFGTRLLTRLALTFRPPRAASPR